ncbi:MAG: 4Fe-4S binding protein [Bacteroides sp.]|nr:4Fe-4S binding protein [Bacteroides sp.]
MNSLRAIRIFVCYIFFAASVLYLFVKGAADNLTHLSESVQIIPSALAMSIGATSFWLVATFVFGRIYCSSVCPVGTLQDSATWLRRNIRRYPKLKHIQNPIGKRPLFAPFSYRHRGKVGSAVLLLYLALLLPGFYALAALLEPWNIMRLAARYFNPAPTSPTPALLFAGDFLAGTITGMFLCGAIWVLALFRGRRFCTQICPIGTILGFISERSVYQIEFDPDKCINCMKCEDICKSECIKVVSRYVDNSRCVRCFDCLHVCPNYAIRYRRDRQRRSTPLLRRRARV